MYGAIGFSDGEGARDVRGDVAIAISDSGIFTVSLLDPVGTMLTGGAAVGSASVLSPGSGVFEIVEMSGLFAD